MSKEVQVFGELMKAHKKSSIQSVLKLAHVKDVKWTDDEKVCDVTLIADGLYIFDVLLGFGTWQLKPKRSSLCLVLELEGNENHGILLWAEEVEEIRINGEQFGGLVNAKELKEQLDKNTQVLKSIQNVFKTFVPVPTDGGAALKVAASVFTSMPLTDLTNIENEIVKHG